MNQAIIIELLVSTLPYPNQIKNIDLNEKDAVQFDWRGARYRVKTTLAVEEVQGGMLVVTSAALLLETNLERARALRKEAR